MHGAPSVSHPVGRSRLAAAFIAGLSLLSLAGLAFWAWQLHPPAVRAAAAFGTALAATAFAWRGWFESPAGVLAWNGEDWSWTGSPPSGLGEPDTVVDLQVCMLLCWRPVAGRVRWLWAERARQPSTWDDLRRAVYSRARPGGAAQRA